MLVSIVYPWLDNTHSYILNGKSTSIFGGIHLGWIEPASPMDSTLQARRSGASLLEILIQFCPHGLLNLTRDLRLALSSSCVAENYRCGGLKSSLSVVTHDHQFGYAVV